MGKKIQVTTEKPPELQVTEQQQKKIDNILEASKKEVTIYWDEKITKEIYIPVDNGEIRVLHVKPEKSINKRAIVFIPGWGVIPAGFHRLYEVLHDSVEFYYVETREKESSKLDFRKADMSINQSAKDIQDTLKFLGLENKEVILAGPCWGATIILIGLLDESLNATTIVAFDPMHKLWFNKFLLEISPVFPAFVVNWLRPVFKFVLFSRMKEKTQKKRSEDFVDAADARKWKKAAYRVRNLELFGMVKDIEREILVFNGTTDKVHKQSDYPKLTKEMPNGRFFFMNTDESNRERLMGVVLKEMVQVDSKTNIPSSLREFEKELKRE